MYQEIRRDAVPCLSFMKNTDYILYVGPNLSLMQKIKLSSTDIRVPVIYLPDALKQLSKDVFAYNFPGIDRPSGMSPEPLYSRIRAELGIPDKMNDHLFVRAEGDGLAFFDAGNDFRLAVSYLLSRRRCSLWDIRVEYPKHINEECRHFSVEPDEDEGIRFSVSGNYESYIDAEEQIDGEMSFCYPEPEAVEADEEFSAHMNRAAGEVHESIKKLLLDGFPVEIILSWLNEEVHLSRLRITRQFKILLLDYDKEVRMGPLPKTVFLFFLRHPEGVRLSYLQDHVDELMHIYEHVCVNDDPKKMRKSIETLVDPFNNSICEKCAAVKKAFMLQVRDSIARNYYITGAQGAEKRITLDRSLVEWECEL